MRAMLTDDDMTNMNAIQKAEVVTLDTTEHARRMEAMRTVIKASICPKGIGEDEFTLFLEQCKRSGLDPLLRQAFCVPRRFNAGNRERPNWTTKHEFQPSESGMLARAEQFPGYEGISGAEVYEEDHVLLDYATGAVEHRVNPAKRKGKLVGAWARVQRAGKVPTLVWVDLTAAQQDSPLWAKMPAVMVRKAARVAALRTAYPEAFGGLYVSGERPDDVENEEEAATPLPLSKPVLPTPSIQPTLETARGLETVPVFDGMRVVAEGHVIEAEEVPSREPGADDGDADPMAAECAAIVREADTVNTQEGYAALAKRAAAFAAGTQERRECSKALKAANARISGAKP